MGLTRQQIVQVSILLLGCLLAELNYTLLAPALPVIMDDMGVGETDVQWLVSVYALVEAVVIPMNAAILGRASTRKLFVASFALFAALYMVETFGWQMVATPTNTWGINALPNEVIQHGTAVLDTLMQVGAAFGTAAIVSLTALAPGIDGYRLGFVGCAALLAVVAAVITAAVRDRDE
ncbi:MAG: MFS transporter [Eggerthellaceae bacterium]|nr:MFS transporter [Eggerthellaceae bacterium]